MDQQNPHESFQSAPQPEVVGEPVAGPTSDERTWAMFAHISALIAVVLTASAGGWIGPLVIWLAKKNESAFVDDQGKESLNFQITIMIAYVVCWGAAIASCGLLFFLPLVPFVLQIVFCIIAALRANEGEYYRYPMTIRLIT